jgi:hypothetical protein
MASTRWSRRRARKAVQRGLTRFDVRLPSARPGIGFTARIRATVLTEPPYPSPVEEIAGAVRTTLRDAASKVSKTCDPADLASARDACGQHLARVRQLPTGHTTPRRHKPWSTGAPRPSGGPSREQSGRFPSQPPGEVVR